VNDDLKVVPQWVGPAPKECDICEEPLVRVFYDIATLAGPWACLCTGCVGVYSRGTLGTGLGQKYELQANGVWLKTGG
jgi:hypothetical protein